MGEPTRKVAVWGSPVIVAPIIDTMPGVELTEVLDDNISVGTKVGMFGHWTVTGNSGKVALLLKDTDISFVITVMTMQRKADLWKKLLLLNIPAGRFIQLIHPTAVVPEKYSHIGRGVVMAPLAQVGPNSVISDNCTMHANSYVGHSSFLERFVVVANNASIGARVVVERGVHIGSNASIREGVRIGEFSLIGMGSVVLEDVPPNTVVAGVPARELRKLEEF